MPRHYGFFLQPSSYCMRLNESLRRSSYLCQQGGGYVIVLSVILCALRRITHERRNGRRSKMAGMGRGRRGSRKKTFGGPGPLNFPSHPLFPTPFPSPWPPKLSLPSLSPFPSPPFPFLPPSPFLFPDPSFPYLSPFPSPHFPPLRSRPP